MAAITIGITGGSGFLGTNLKRYLLKKRIKFKEFSGDLLKEKDVTIFFERYHTTHLIHLAGLVDGSFDKLMQKNCLTTENVLRIGSKFGLKKIIFASTGAVYGEPVKSKSYESDELSPNTLYGISKLAGEEIINYYHQVYKLSYIILRFPSIYGQGNDKGVIFNFLSDIKKKKEITIYGDGQQRRNFLHVSDACKAIDKALKYKHSDTFNIAPKKNYSLLEIIKELSQKYSFSTLHKPAEEKVQNLILDTKKAEKILNFSAKKDIADFFTSTK